jgi:hypothetical protein
MDPKVAGAWRTGTSSVKVSGTWRSVSEAWVRVAGVWRKFYDTISVPPGTKVQFRATAQSSSSSGVTTRQVSQFASDETDAGFKYNELVADPAGNIWNWCQARVTLLVVSKLLYSQMLLSLPHSELRLN